MIALHAQWTDGMLALWGERPGGVHAAAGDTDQHPAAVGAEVVVRLIRGVAPAVGEVLCGEAALLLPTRRGVPIASPALAHASGVDAHCESEMEPVSLRAWRVPCARVGPGDTPSVLEALEDEDARRVETAPLWDGENGRFVLGDSVRFFASAARLAQVFLAQQRVVPSIEAGPGDGLCGVWRPWIHDEQTMHTVRTLASVMPPSARSMLDSFAHQAGPILDDFLTRVADAACRRALVRESIIDALNHRTSCEPETAWLAGLLGPTRIIHAEEPLRVLLQRTVRRWIAGLEDSGIAGEWRLCLRLNEPRLLSDVPDFEAPGEDVAWSLTFHLQSQDNESLLIDAEDVWALRGDSATVRGRRVERPQELLLKALARAARVYPMLERAVQGPAPVALPLTTRQAYEFLREYRSLLTDQGIGVVVPDWWDSPAARIGARLMLDSPVHADHRHAAGPTGAGKSMLGLASLVHYEWRLAVGETPLTFEQFERLAASREPLIRLGGRWVEVRPEDVATALRFMRENPGGPIRVGDALSLAYRSDPTRTGLPITGVDATGWIAVMLGGTGAQPAPAIPTLSTPRRFRGLLRPYQARGLSWLVFLDSLGLGPCLADDMGLGKTIQLLALLLHEREQADTQPLEPTLLVVPMSIVANWKRETERFAPDLRVLVHHGVDRLAGEEFFQAAIRSDLVITTYALAHRDRDLLELVPWRRVVLDEAQNVKNPAAKQSQAVRSLPVSRRLALTGTPLENRLSELWSIMDFCNPGLLGTLHEFRSWFSVPIERRHDKERARRLRSLVRPFILRRLKTDPTVISDLPPKVETREYCKLTSEQASLYEACVKDMLSKIDAADGIRRRGLVLTALVRLKQICNHPAQLPDSGGVGLPSSADPRDAGSRADAGPKMDSRHPPDHSPSRSGKCIRLLELMEEVIASGEQALVFTQFRQMAGILARILTRALDRDVLLLHGGTPQAQRQHLIDRFQKADGSAPVLVLSLKAGGVGLNLTAASHVFHFDRWWNPAVENQATDRAFRIGQTRTVNVHKFIVSGTLEDRIDQMIESKIALAEDIIGAGEDWLTELSTAQLRDILTLRPEALADE